MIVLWIILWILVALVGLILILLSWALVVPFRVDVDSEKGLYKAGIPGLFMARAEPVKDLFIIRLKIFFLNYWIDPFTKKKKIAKSEKEVSEDKKAKRKNKGRQFKMKGMLRPSLRFLKDIFRAIKLKKLIIDFDTGDDILNAELIPLCYIFSRENRSVMVNFNDFQRVVIQIRARLLWFVTGGIRFAWSAFVKPRFKIR
jgi:hypothetical protein